MRAALCVLALCLSSGCALQPRTAARIDRHGSPQVRQTGDAKTPASASVTTTETTLTIPAGSKVEIPSPSPATTEGVQVPAAVVVTLSESVPLHIASRLEAVAGAETPPPPSPPSAVEKARSFGVRWFYILGGLSGLAAILAFLRGYPLGAIYCAGGAIAFPLAGNLVSEKWAIVAGGVCLVAAVATVLAWKLIAKRHALTQAT